MSTSTDTAQPKAVSAKTVAAIDVGANAFRLVVAEVLPDGQIEVLERLHRAVRLGQDTFRRGRLGGQSMRAAIAVFRDFLQIINLYKAEQIRAVATTAVREAGNVDTFLDRVFMATGLNLEVLDTSEESRLTVSAVHPIVRDALGPDHTETLLADVGGGSTLLTLLHHDEIITSQSLRLGSIRLQEMLSTGREPPQRSAELLRQHIANTLDTFQGNLPLTQIESLIAVGGDARFAARQIGRPTASAELTTVELDDFDGLVAQTQRYTPEELVRRYGVPFADAETLNPALLVYQALLHTTRAKRIIVSQVSMRDGLLLELARNVTGQEDTALTEGAIHSAVALVEKYRGDMQHAGDVADLATQLFDDLQADHGLRPRHRLLLRVAALLHEIGSFVSSRSHHKHSYYLIINSEVFGISRRETQVVALVARYHRRSVPKPSHLEYISLPRETRVVVVKLAAILRVADAMVRGHIPQGRRVRYERQGDDWVFYVPRMSDYILEQRAMASKGDLFEDVYGMKVRLEEA